MLNTIKEIIQNSTNIIDELFEIKVFLSNLSENADESSRNIIAECLGKSIYFN